MPVETPWITAVEAAEKSGCSVRTIERWLKTGRIEGWKPGHDWLTTLDAVMTYKEKVKRGRPRKNR